MLLLMKISLIKKMDPTCLSQQFCLIARFIHGCSTAACLISQLFFLASSQTLGSCQICYLQLLFSKDCCLSFTHTHIHTHTLAHLSQGKGRVVAWLSVLFSFPLVLPRSTGEFYFQFSNSICSTFRKKLSVTCTSPLPPTSFPCVFHFLVREVFPMLLCSSSRVAYQGGQWQNFTPSAWLLPLQGFHSCCAAHWGFVPARSQVACYNWCEK